MANASIYIAHRRKYDNEPQSVKDHLFGVAQLASQFGDKLGLRLHGELLGLLHDIGKYSQEFQDYINGLRVCISKVDHSTAGAQHVWRELSPTGCLPAVVAQFLALCIASHHGGLIDCLTPEGQDEFSARMQKHEARVHHDEVLGKADLEVLERCRQIVADPALVHDLTTMLKAINERQGSIEQHGKETRTRLMGGLLLRMLFSCLIDADRTNTADFEAPHKVHLRSSGYYVAWPTLIQRLEKHLASFEKTRPIDQFRSRVSDECLRASERTKGIFSLTVPTGGGKTLASLRFALHHAMKRRHDRIIYVVPYTTIIDQNAQDTRQILEPGDAAESYNSVVLEHHSNLTPEEETPKSKLLSENWDARVIFTTAVQLLESLFGAGTRGVRRMHQLMNAVLIFDEIQTLPVNMIHLFCNAMNFLVDYCGATVVLCTATQPLLHEVDRAKGAIALDGEIVSNVDALFGNLRRVDIVDRRKAAGWTNTELCDLIKESVRISKSCLVVVNTKKAALSLYRTCKTASAEALICHLSTSMCPAHRSDVLEQIGRRLGRNRKAPVEQGQLICISTQLIEAGVDVDFGCVIRSVAGLDSIAQAAGRCNRNGHRDKGIVSIVNPVDESLRLLEDIRAGKEAAIRILGEFVDSPASLGGDLLSPSAIKRYFHYYFFERKHLMDYPISEPRDDSLLNLLSINSNAVEEYKRQNETSPEIYWRQAFKTAARAFKAIDAPTQGVIAPYGDEGKKLICDLCAASDSGTLFRLLRRAQRFSINVFPWILNQLQKDGAVHEIQPGTGILHLDPRYYSEEFGLSETPVAEQEFLNA